MRNKKGREERESKLASGWTVESEPSDPTTDSDVAGSPMLSGSTGGGVSHPGDAEIAAGSDHLNGEDGTDAPSQMSNGSLVILGVIGGLYLLYTWVWFSWAEYYAAQNTYFAEVSGSFGFVLQQMTFWAAPVAPALWFLSAYILNKNAPTWRLAMWLLIGAVLLVPLPMFGAFWGAPA